MQCLKYILAILFFIQFENGITMEVAQSESTIFSGDFLSPTAIECLVGYMYSKKDWSLTETTENIMALTFLNKHWNKTIKGGTVIKILKEKKGPQIKKRQTLILDPRPKFTFAWYQEQKLINEHNQHQKEQEIYYERARYHRINSMPKYQKIFNSVFLFETTNDSDDFAGN